MWFPPWPSPDSSWPDNNPDPLADCTCECACVWVCTYTRILSCSAHSTLPGVQLFDWTDSSTVSSQLYLSHIRSLQGILSLVAFAVPLHVTFLLRKKAQSIMTNANDVVDITFVTTEVVIHVEQMKELTLSLSFVLSIIFCSRTTLN